MHALGFAQDLPRGRQVDHDVVAHLLGQDELPVRTVSSSSRVLRSVLGERTESWLPGLALSFSARLAKARRRRPASLGSGCEPPKVQLVLALRINADQHRIMFLPADIGPAQCRASAASRPRKSGLSSSWERTSAGIERLRVERVAARLW